MLKDNFLASLSNPIILTSTVWPIFNTSLAFLMWFQEICDKCNNPSIPLISTKAPKFVNLFTSPFKISPRLKLSQAFASSAFLTSSNNILLDATTFTGFFKEKSINLISKFLPTYSFLSSVNLMSIWDPGTKTLTPL